MNLPLYFIVISFAIISVAFSTTAIDKMDIDQMIEKAQTNGLKVIYNSNGRSIPFIFDPLVNALSSMTTSAGIKTGLIYSGGMWILDTFFPHTLEYIGLSSGNTGLGSFDIYGIRKYASEIPGKLKPYFHIPEVECQYRAICETSVYIATKLPLLNDWIKRFSGTLFLNLANPYARAWLNGVMNNDCSTIYLLCPQSPFASIINNLKMRR